jgi:hypothetical protein
MTRIEMALLAFTSFNAVRVLAYFPQMAAIVRDTNGATAVSYWTWSLFAASHLSTVAYALVAVRNCQMATVFAINAACCIAIILLTFHKRRRHRSNRQPHGDAVDPEPVQPEVLNRFSPDHGLANVVSFGAPRTKPRSLPDAPGRHQNWAIPQKQEHVRGNRETVRPMGDGTDLRTRRPA